MKDEIMYEQVTENAVSFKRRIAKRIMKNLVNVELADGAMQKAAIQSMMETSQKEN